MMKVKGDALFSLALFAIFSFGTYRSLVMDDPAGGPNDVGAAFFPFWICVFIQVLTALVFVQSVTNVRSEGVPQSEGNGVLMRKRLVLLIGILALLFFYIMVMERVGFIISSTVFLILVHQLLIFSETSRPSPPKGIAVSAAFFAVTAGSLFFVFNTVFHLALP
jgi:hypothetical protein